MSRIRADRYTNRLGTGAPVFSNGVNITGNVGVGTTVPTSKLTVVGNMNVTGTVSVGGTLTYEDVTNIDSVGIITAQAGVNVTGSTVTVGTAITLRQNGNAEYSGVILAGIDPRGGGGTGLYIDGSSGAIVAGATGSNAILKGFQSGGSEKFRFSADGTGFLMGDAGIGTDTLNNLSRVSIQMPTAGGAGAITVVNNSQGIGNTNIVLRSIDNNGGNWADAEFRAEGYSFKSGTQERLHITASGQVTKPSNAAFRAQGNTQYANQTSSFDPIYDNEIFDAGGNYNPTNGRFTAPVDGKYFFYFVFLTYPDNDPTYKTLGFTVNGSQSYNNGFTRRQSSSQNSNQVSTFLNLSANDYVIPHVQLPSGTFDFYMVTGHAHFFGYLVS